MCFVLKWAFRRVTYIRHEPRCRASPAIPSCLCSAYPTPSATQSTEHTIFDNSQNLRDSGSASTFGSIGRPLLKKSSLIQPFPEPEGGGVPENALNRNRKKIHAARTPPHHQLQSENTCYEGPWAPYHYVKALHPP